MGEEILLQTLPRLEGETQLLYYRFRSYFKAALLNVDIIMSSVADSVAGLIHDLIVLLCKLTKGTLPETRADIYAFRFRRGRRQNTAQTAQDNRKPNAADRQLCLVAKLILVSGFKGDFNCALYKIVEMTGNLFAFYFIDVQ